MNYKQIKDFLSTVKYHKYWTMGGDLKASLDEHEDISMDQNFNLIKNMDSRKEFVVKDDDIDFLKALMPERFITKDSINFFYKGLFWTLSLKDHICKPSEEEPNDDYIFDIQRSGLDMFAARVGMAVKQMEMAVRDYENNCDYYSWHYGVVQKVDCSDKYDQAYSLTKEETKKVDEWTAKHMKKHHKDWYKQYHGASPVWPFEIRFGSCSLGTWADCDCTICKKEYELALHEFEDSKAAEKIKKDMSYQIRGIE